MHLTMLRTPLAIMRTTAEVALRSLEGAEHKEALEQIVAELERTSHLVDNLLLLSKADSSSAAPVLDVQLKLLLPEEPVYVNGDASALRRLFLLLLDNGIKYTPAGGTIEVALNEEGDEAQASVRDTGIGIPERDLPYIFERFYRVDESRFREQGGAGLGLSIGRWIAETHGGILSVESARNCGSIFSLRLRTLELAAIELTRRGDDEYIHAHRMPMHWSLRGPLRPRREKSGADSPTAGSSDFCECAATS